MVIWRGWGILVFFAAIAGIWLGVGVIVNMLTLEPAYARSSVAIAIGFFIAAVLALGIWLLRYFQIIDRPVGVAAPGEKVRRPSSALFFIPLIAWPIIFAALGVLGLVVGLTRG